MEQKKIYIVTSGSYSDYHIERVFSTKEKADEFLDLHDDDYDVEEYELDAEIPKGENKLWRIEMTLDKKDVRYCEVIEGEDYMKDLIQFNRYNTDNRDVEVIDFYILSDSRSRAVKIASERFGAVVANEQTMYPYLRRLIVRHRHNSKDYPFYDFNTGKVMLDDEDKLDEDLPKGIKYKRFDTEE